MSDTLDCFKRMQNLVFDRSPVLKQIVQEHGTESVYDYVQRYTVNTRSGELLTERKEEFLSVFSDQLEALLGAEVASEATEQLRKYYFVSTSEHHGPVCSAANAVTLALLRDAGHSGLKYLITLSCAGVSLNNFDFPRGFIFTVFDGQDARVHRISFLPSNSHSSTIHRFRPYSKVDIEKIKKSLREKVRASELTPEMFDRMHKMVDEIYNAPEVLNCAGFSDQVTKTNFTLSKKFFPGQEGPAFIYLELEGLVIELLKRFHLTQKTAVHEFLFNPEYWTALEEHFDTIEGAFTLAEKGGTYLFWGLNNPKDNVRVPLWREGNALVSEDGSVRVELTPEGLRQAFEEEKIFPSTLITFLVLAFYYGLECLGFFKQVDYLSVMRDAYVQMNEKLGKKVEADFAAEVNTMDLYGDFALSFIEAGGKRYRTDGIDLALYGDLDTLPVLIKESRSIQLGEALNPLMPIFYRVLYSGPTRDPELLTLTPEAISEQFGLKDKIKPCAHFNEAI